MTEANDKRLPTTYPTELAATHSPSDVRAMHLSTIGTPYYMSPEAWQGKEQDAQSDI